MAWLGTWKYRVKAKIDYTNKIGSSVTHFPVTIFINNSAGVNNKDLTFIFDEVGSNYQKIAVTKSDGTTQLYVEVEQWDSTNEKAVLHISKSDWTISGDTYIYLYFDNSQPNNTTYVGTTNTSVAENVWDTYYKAVWHLSNLYDSTSNNNDLTNNGSVGTTDGKIATAYQFVGDKYKYLSIASNSSLKPSKFTISLWAYWTSTQIDKLILSKYSAFPCDYEIGFKASGDYNIFVRSDTTSVAYYAYDTSAQSTYTGYWTHITGLYDGSVLKLYVNGSYKASSSSFTRANSRTDPLNIGRRSYTGAEGPFTGLVDEVRLSSIDRSSAWIKGEYYSLSDNLLTWEITEYTTLALRSTIEKTTQKTVALTSTFDIFGETILVSPEHETSGPSPVTFVWKIPTISTNEPLHAHLQVDKTSNSFEDLEVDLYSYKDSGFEYWDGSQWQPWPAEGVSSAYYGNNARITVDLTSGIKYWRVRHGREIT